MPENLKTPQQDPTLSFTRIDHIAIHVTDLKRACQFYQDCFGFTLHFSDVIPSGKKIIYLTLGNTMLELAEGASESSGFHFCLHTNNFNQAICFLQSKGLKYHMKPHKTNPRTSKEINWLRAVFLGLDGEHIEIRGPANGY